MSGQDYAVWAIGIVAAAVAVRYVWRLLRGGGGRCASCGDRQCPHRKR